MSDNGLTIAEAAKLLGVSSRTVRRFIKSGKIHAELVSGPFGNEYRIPELPPDLRRPRTRGNRAGHTLGQEFVHTPVQSIIQTPVQASIEVLGIIRELQEKNLVLAAQLGAATERIRNLESQVRLLTAARQPWWRRLLGRIAR